MTTSLPYTRPALASKRLYPVKCRYCGTVVAVVDQPNVTVTRNQCPGRDCRMPVEARSG